MGECALLERDWSNRLAELLQGAQRDLLIASPFITRSGAEFVAENVSSGFRAAGRLTIVTDLRPEHVCQGSTEPEALRALSSVMPACAIQYLPRIHAKVYVADCHSAIVTSANLTEGGLFHNYEYGVEVNHPRMAAEIRRDIEAYASLGSPVGPDALAAYCRLAAETREAYRRAQKAVSASARRDLDRALRSAGDELLRLRLAGGPVHAVFARTILYLLGRHGPLSTMRLHQLIESIHPDLCDNTVDRVIDGKRFGKKWKHAVRTAQQHLRRKGLIEPPKRRGDLWRLKQGEPG